MKLQEIDKVRYRNHVKKVIVGCIAALALGSLAISQTLIAIFPGDESTHFHWNLTGVIITAGGIWAVLYKVKSHPFMAEVMYVWELKQAMNQIIRKMRKLKTACENGNESAMQAMQFFYAASRQLAHLDDNTITLENLEEDQAKLNNMASQANIVLNAYLYNPASLKTL